MIKIYSKANCKWCVRAKELATENEIEFEEVVIGTDIKRVDFLNLFPGVGTVPQILNGEDLIGGYEKFAEWVEGR